MHLAKEVYTKLVRSHFPPVNFAFAYGSAVFKQHGRDKGKMLDLIFAVDDPLKWHEENIERNKHHYSFLQYFGSGTVTRFQKLSAGVYYNPFVVVNSQLLKYGVISVEDLLDDLINWKWLYISGRLHKPVLILSDVDRQIQAALDSNLRSAVLCALLCLQKPQFSSVDLYMAITSLSFQGDFRMIVGEDKNKVRNIVTPNLSHFSKLYEPYTNTLLEESTSGLLRIVRPVNICDLPSHVRSGIEEGKTIEDGGQCVVVIHVTPELGAWSNTSHTVNKKFPELLLMYRELINPSESVIDLSQCYLVYSVLARIVSESSYKQSAKGILSAGFVKTLKYSIQKLQKMARSFD